MTTKLSNKQTIESSFLFIDLSKSLLTKIDSYIITKNLNKEEQLQFIKILEEVYGEAYTNGMVD